MCNNFGDNLRKYRNEKKLGINELGRKIGVSGAYISALETGKKQNPSLDMIDKISNALDIPSSFLTITNKQNSIFAKFNSKVDKEQLAEEMNKYKAYTQFFNVLGFNLDFMQNYDSDDTFICINDVYYTLTQFDTLLEMMKCCVDNSNKLLDN
jgi:transcriptional regulator with XRE-family HTH domain